MTKVALALVAAFAVSFSGAHADTLLLRGDRQFCEKSACRIDEDTTALEAVLRGDRCVLWADTLQPVIDKFGLANMRGRTFTISRPVTVPPIRLDAPARIGWATGRKMKSTPYVFRFGDHQPEYWAAGPFEEYPFSITDARLEPVAVGYRILIAGRSGAPVLWDVTLNGDDWTIDPAVEKTDTKCGEPTS